MTTPTAVVTGASGGVGRRVTALLLEKGWVVWAQYRREPDPLLDHPHVYWWQSDFSSPTSVAPPVLGTSRLDALVHTAGVVSLGTTADAPLADWIDTMNVNLFAAVELTRQLLPQLRAARGQLIYLNSGAGKTAHAGWGSYAASKFAARAWCDALREEEPSIRVTGVYPGRIDTNMQQCVVTQEGGTYTPEAYLSPDTVAANIVNILETPPDALVSEVIIRPKPRI